MALADTARLVASLDLKGNFAAQLRANENALGSFDSRLARTQSRSFRAGEQIGRGIRNTARLIAGATLTVGVASAAVFTKALGAASDLSETISKVGVVFGKQAARIREFGKTSADALGLSENAALSAAATYGNLFVSMGLAEKKSADMSLKLVKLASDLASFNNIDPTEALEKLRAGLTGESEPLKSLGINLNEQTLKAKALELGLVKLEKGQKKYTAVLSPAIKAQAAYALILEQSKTAQGDFERTQGGLANQTRILRANWEDLKATLAGPSLPQVAKIMQAINKAVKDNQPEIAKLGDSIAGLFSDENIKTGTEVLKRAFQTAKETAPIVAEAAKTTFSFVQSAVGLFRSLPPEIQKLAIGAFAINKVTGGLVTNIAGGIIETVGKQFLQRGGTPANPLFVVDVTGGLGKLAGAGAGAAAATGAGAAAAAALPIAVIAASIAGPIIAQQKISSNLQIQAFNDVTTNVQRQIASGASLADLQKSLAAVNTGIHEIESNPLNVLVGGQALDELKKNRTAIQQQIDAVKLAGRDTVGGIEHLATVQASELGARRAEAAENRAMLAGLPNEFSRAIKGIREARQPENVLAAIKAGLAQISKGRGNLEGTKSLISALKGQLERVHDPKLRAALKAAIEKVEKRLPAREFAAKQLAKADSLIRDGKITNRDLKDIKGIERALKDRGLPHAASVIRARIATAQAAQVAATNAAKLAIDRKKWQFTNNVQVNTSVRVSARETSKTQTTMKRGYVTLS